MKKNLLILVAAVLALAFTSCKTTQQTSYYSVYNHADTRYLQCGNGMMYDLAAVEADLSFDKNRISYQERFENELESHDVNDPKNSNLINYWKDYTVFKAAAQYQADLIVGATFCITTSPDFKYVTVEVRGYPASYNNFRQVKPVETAHVAEKAKEVKHCAEKCHAGEPNVQNINIYCNGEKMEMPAPAMGGCCCCKPGMPQNINLKDANGCCNINISTPEKPCCKEGKECKEGKGLPEVKMPKVGKNK